MKKLFLPLVLGLLLVAGNTTASTVKSSKGQSSPTHLHSIQSSSGKYGSGSTTPSGGKSGGSTPSGAGGKYGSGSTTPSGGTTPSGAGGKYGSGSTTPSGGKTPSGGSTTPSGAGGKYGSGSTPSGADVGTKPKNSGFDAKAGQAQKKEESKEAYKNATKGNAPAPHYVDHEGKEQKIDPADKRVTQLREQLNQEKWKNRDLREREFYRTYYDRPVVVYHDPYNSFFWYWMLDRSIEEQALWAYNHSPGAIGGMDVARYNALLARDANLAARVKTLEAQNAARDPSYTPPGLSDPDLMYTDDYVHAVYNPDVPAGSSEGAGTVLLVLLVIVLVLAAGAGVFYLVFVKKWGD